MVDEFSDLLIASTISMQAKARGARRHDPANLIRATRESKTVAGAPRGSDGTRRRQFLKNDVDDAFDIGQRTGPVNSSAIARALESWLTV